MPRPSISRIRALVRSLSYVVSLHAVGELEDEDLTILDLENIILTGRIVERQKDRQTRETKIVTEAGRSMTARPKRSSKSATRAFSTSSRSISSSGVCASCGRSGVHLRRVTRSFGSGKSLLVVEGIPMWSCPHCGESYFTAQTLHELERIKALRKSVAVERRVSVAGFHAQGA